MGFFDLFQQADIDQGVKEYLATPGAVLLDVRTSEEYRDGHIPGSKNVPLQALDKVASVAENKKYGTVCLLPLWRPEPSGCRLAAAYGISQCKQHRRHCSLCGKGGTII